MLKRLGAGQVTHQDSGNGITHRTGGHRQLPPQAIAQLQQGIGADQHDHTAKAEQKTKQAARGHDFIGKDTAQHQRR